MLHSRKFQYMLGSLVCLIGTAAVYRMTLAPTVQGFDSAELTVGAYTLGLVHPTGYPLYMLIGHWAIQLPLGEVGFRLNLLSAILGAVSVGLLCYLTSIQTKSALTAMTIAPLFALAPHVWSQSIKAEVYTLHNLLIISVLLTWFLAHQNKQPAYALLYFGILGLATGNHATSILLGFAILACTDWRDTRWRNYSITGMMMGASVALLLYLYFPWRTGDPTATNYILEYFGRDPRKPADLLWLISGQAFRCSVNPAWNIQDFYVQILRLVTFLWDGSLGLAPLLGVWGWTILRTTAPRWNRLLTVYFLANLAFFLAYQVVDKEAMFLPTYLIMDLWIAMGILGFARWLPEHLPKLNQARALLLTNLVLLSILGIGMLLDWSTIDLSQDYQVHNFAARVLQELPPGTIVVNHWATASVFDYFRVIERVRPDVRSFNLDFFFLGTQSTCQVSPGADINRAWFDWIELQTIQQTPLCFIEPLPSIPENYQFVKQGACWKLQPGQ